MSIYVKSIEKALLEVNRFLEAINELKKNGETYNTTNKQFDGSKYTAAVRRTSMDLTRSLVDIRRNSGYHKQTNK